ncbi:MULTISPECIES: iron ABC transporter permease [unclassified Halomonas]|uniref:FecCD family ABC transporter permease n=1 Tax=unclassified Halomonas TaxID=2609666 RepID=UPI0028883382|nr:MULTISPECIES: iron ABC transporter permease [unclassified Halomonas]MDT0501170.1 iron ABC transporter permease [Halomonas sp. PAR7]MDT0511451.1 iron ABC transporter permease [Halomonas sp. LES1]MDT0590261.1 iron ABC transporter permease [Halomonas sp. PAR8]
MTHTPSLSQRLDPASAATADAGRARYASLLGLLWLVLLASMGLSLGLGSFPTSFGEILHALAAPQDSDIAFIAWELRLPRLLLAVLVGAALAVAGAILQGMVRNPLASPDVIGITSGAALAAVTFLALFGTTLSTNWLPAAAQLGALLAALLVFLLAWKGSVSPSRLVLVGIGLSAAMGALTTLLIVISDDAAAMTAYVWLTGSLYAAQWQDVLGMLPWLLVAIPLGLAQARHMDAMALGDAVAQGLGVNLLRSRLVLMACSVALAGAAVAFAGGLSFVGLVAPHIASRLVGRGFARLVPAAALVGALIVLYADLLGRVAFLPKDLPAGIFVSGVGAPFFVYLLHRTRYRRG